MSTWLSLIDLGRDIYDIHPNYIWTLNFAVKKDVFIKCGGFHPDLTPGIYQRWQGDGETGFTEKFHQMGFKASYVQSMRVFHHCREDRLTAEYFKKRAFFQGICDSFSSLRAGERPLSKEITDVFPERGKVLSSWSEESYPIMLETDHCYREGWLFHQKEVGLDPALLRWVMRDSFIDADIRPEFAAYSKRPDSITTPLRES